MEQKECNRCGEVKDLSEYTFHKKSGYYNFCKTCDSNKKKEYRDIKKHKSWNKDHFESWLFKETIT